MKKTYAYLVVASLGFLASCSKDDPTPTPTAAPSTELAATIDESQQADAKGPARTGSKATGTFTGTYNSSNKQLTYTVTYQGLTPTYAHIHTGAPGAVGAVAIPFASLASPITGTVTLTTEQADNLLNNRMYVNIHSAAFGAGEIRGDIRKK